MYTVLATYKDRVTGEIHQEGSKVELTDDRYTELSGLGYVKKKPAPAVKEDASSKQRSTKEEKSTKNTK